MTYSSFWHTGTKQAPSKYDGTDSTIHRHAGNKRPAFAAERPLLMLRTEFAPGITGPNAGNHVPSIKKKRTIAQIKTIYSTSQEQPPRTNNTYIRIKKPYNRRHEPILRSEIHRTWAEYRIIGLDRKSNAAPFTDLDFPAQFGLTSFPKSK